MPRIKPEAAKCEARILSFVLCGPSLSQFFVRLKGEWGTRIRIDWFLVVTSGSFLYIVQVWKRESILGSFGILLFFQLDYSATALTPFPVPSSLLLLLVFKSNARIEITSVLLLAPFSRST